MKPLKVGDKVMWNPPDGGPEVMMRVKRLSLKADGHGGSVDVDEAEWSDLAQDKVTVSLHGDRWAHGNALSPCPRRRATRSGAISFPSTE